MGATDLGLVGDVGATNARFALVAADGSLSQHANLLCEDYPGLAEAIDAYLARAGTARPRRAVLAVATSPNGDRVAFTNNPSTSGLPNSPSIWASRGCAWSTTSTPTRSPCRG